MAGTKPILNILIPDTHDSLLLAIADISYYPATFTITNPTVEITPPSFWKTTISITAKGFTVLDSNDLGITCSDDDCNLSVLPDGIWEVTYSITPSTDYSVTKKFLKVDQFQKKFEEAFMKTDLAECDVNIKDQDKEVLDMIDYFIQGAIATANDCNYTRAMDLYKEASKMLNNFNKTK